MCAECHSTGLRKNYDAQADRFATTWAEISVGCEACHGQGSNHVAWAHARQSWWPFGKSHEDPSKGLLVRYRRAQQTSPGRSIRRTGNSTRSAAPATLRTEVETCGRCHARRGQLSEEWVPGHWLSRYSRGLSRSAAGSITPTGRCATRSITTARSSRARCLPPASPAAIATIRTAASRGTAKTISACNVMRPTNTPTRDTIGMRRRPAARLRMSCHMPVRTYMVVDRRHDHAFPRSASRSVRAARTRRTPATIATPIGRRNGPPTAIEKWHGPNRKGFQTFAPALAASWAGRADASKLLAAVAADRAPPDIVRATVLTELNAVLSPEAIGQATSRSCRTPIRWCGSARSICSKARRRRSCGRSLRRCLSDPIRGVRIRAASLLALVPTAQQPVTDRPRFEQAAEEFVAAQRLNADRPEARSALGRFLAAARAGDRGRNGIQGGPAAQPGLRSGRGQSGRSVSADRPGH